MNGSISGLEAARTQPEVRGGARAAGDGRTPKARADSWCARKRVSVLVCGRLLPLWLAFGVAVMSFPAARAETVAPHQPEPLATGAAASGPGPTDPDELRAFFDEQFREAMAAEHIPGLAAVLVKNGQVFYRGGYGWADVEQQRPIEVDRTLFPLGSVSKVFTTVAILQLVDQGKLTLDEDLQTYVAPVRIDRRFSAPVTLHHVLTHTDGFDVRWLFGGAAADVASLQSLERRLAQVPPRILPPGELYLYSDVGISLAGYALERRTGYRFEDYMEEHVLGPLGMRQSTFRQPFTAERLQHRATGYEATYDGLGGNRALPVAYPHSAPASALSAPIVDLAPFMVALLQGGEHAGRRLLTPDSARRLVTRQFSHHDGVLGTCYGFYEYERNGERGLLHGGLMLGFTSVVFLLPDQQVGLAVAANKFGLVTLLEERLLQRFMDRYYPPRSVEPAGDTPTPPPPGAAPALTAPAAAYAGRYRVDQYSRRSIDKVALASGWGSEIEVRPEVDGALTFLPGGSRWREVEPWLFANEATGERVAFRLGDDGRAERIVGSAQFMSYHRLSWFERLRVQAGLAGAFVAVVLGSAAGGAVSMVLPSRDRPPPLSRRVIAARALSSATAALVLGFIGGLHQAMDGMDFATAYLGDFPVFLTALQLPLVFTVTGLIAGAIAVHTPARSWPRRWERVAYLALGCAVLLFLPVLHYWNLLDLPVSL